MSKTQVTPKGNASMSFTYPMSISLDDGTYGHGKVVGSRSPSLSWTFRNYPMCCAMLHIESFQMTGGYIKGEPSWGMTQADSGKRFFTLLERDRDELVEEIKEGFTPVRSYFQHIGGITGVIAYHNKDEWPYWDKFVELLCEIFELKFEVGMVVKSNHADYPCIQFNAVTREYKGDIISEIMPMSLRNAERAA